MQNFNHSKNNNNNQNNNETRQSRSSMNTQKRNQDEGFFTKAVNWGVSLAVKYGTTFEIVIWVLTVIGILFVPILSILMTYFAYCYSKVNPTRGRIMMGVALIGGIISWIFFGKSNDNSSDGDVWYYFWTE